MINGSLEQKETTIKKGYHECFIQLTTLSEAKFILDMLEAIYNALDIDEDDYRREIMEKFYKGSIPEWLISLQGHGNFEVYEKAYKILENFFNCEEG